MKPVELSVFRRRMPKASERLARQLATSIVTGEIEEGSRLPNEADMLEQLQVGRATLREALRLLEVWGLVVIRTGPGGGPTVRRPTSSELADQLALILQLQRLTLQDVCDALFALEPMLAQHAAESVTPDTVARLRGVVAAMGASRDEPAEFWSHDARFHSLVAQAGRSEVVSLVVDALKVIGERASAGARWTRTELDEVIRAHTQVVDMLEAGDVDGAAEAMRGRVDVGRRFLAKGSPEAALAHTLWQE